MIMNIDVIFKIAGIGIVITVLNQVLIKAGRDEQATFITLVGVVVVLTMVVNLVTNLFDTVKTMFQLY
ncbi:stage III sporulation protein AC [Alkaliphilus oremlandii]|uniref:Stage III sporulation AC family protein n=1 Tax=Alkaliphilus oremlandii (strain OhILAs) TaxID=350688 RepID=A8MFK0_ALKOO|nr:stage III sporulation protein AC [Alkaliphilus oremlandii]ABW19163.1 Stage III sporulation AC family protein [Alkaliphilus oremlandii OhILAs]